jgi:hypothetical protein
LLPFFVSFFRKDRLSSRCWQFWQMKISTEGEVAETTATSTVRTFSAGGSAVLLVNTARTQRGEERRDVPPFGFFCAATPLLFRFFNAKNFGNLRCVQLPNLSSSPVALRLNPPSSSTYCAAFSGLNTLPPTAGEGRTSAREILICVSTRDLAPVVGTPRTRSCKGGVEEREEEEEEVMLRGGGATQEGINSAAWTASRATRLTFAGGGACC